MRHDPKSLMIFAAGLGTRMGLLTQERPKPLVEVAGRPLIDYALDQAKMPGLETVVVNTHYHAEALADHLASRNVVLSNEVDKLLDTGGGLQFARPLLGTGPVFTLNSDAVWTGRNALDELCAAWDPDRMDALLLLLHPRDTIGHARAGSFVMAANGQLARGAGLVYSGAQIINTALLDGIEEEVFSLNLVWDRIAASGRLFGAMHDGKWCDVGHPDGITLAESLLATVNNV